MSASARSGFAQSGGALHETGNDCRKLFKISFWRNIIFKTIFRCRNDHLPAQRAAESGKLASCLLNEFATAIGLSHFYFSARLPIALLNLLRNS